MKKGWLEPMSTVDSLWYSMDESTNRMVITTVMEFTRCVDYEKLKDLLEKRLLIYKRFRQRVVWPATRLGLPFWDYDANFDIQNHVVKLALPSPGDKNALARMISDFAIVPLDRERPLWQVHIIENYDKGSVILVRIHHAIADGIALVRLLFSLTDLQPKGPSAAWPKRYSDEPDTRPAIGKKGKTKVELIQETLNLLLRTGEVSMMKSLNLTEFIQKEVMKTVTHPTYIKKFARNSAGIGLSLGVALFRMIFIPDEKKSCFRGKIGTQKSVFWSNPVKLDKIKKISCFHRCTDNDVIMAAVAGALRTYGISRGSDFSDTEARFAIPVNVGSGGPNIELCNKFSFVFLSLPLHIQDPLKRLLEIRKRIRVIKNSPDAYVGYQALKMLGLPPKRITRHITGLLSRKLTGVLANIPGPQAPLYLTGLPIRNIMFWVPRMGSVGLGISIFSYAGAVTLGIASDSQLVPDPEAITVLFDQELEQMHMLTHSKTDDNVTCAGGA
jgi:diacylglycerol O-acyltransferase / wax synthase